LHDLHREEHRIREDEGAVLLAGGEPGQGPSHQEAPAGDGNLVHDRPDVVVTSGTSPRRGEHSLRIHPRRKWDIARAQRAPRPVSSAGTVRRSMARSSPMLQRSTYSRSRAIHWSKPTVLRPLTCHRPVIPGRTLKRRRWLPTSARVSTSGRGLGPTRLMCPRSTLTSWGSSSRLVRRSQRPTGVTRGSSRILKTGPSISFAARSTARSASAPWRIVRNLSIG